MENEEKGSRILQTDDSVDSVIISEVENMQSFTHQNDENEIDVAKSQHKADKVLEEDNDDDESKRSDDTSVVENNQSFNNSQTNNDILNEDAHEEKTGVRSEHESTGMDVNFYYENEDYFSKPFSTENISNDLLSLHHSFGYECQKRSNLHILSNDEILFSTGNFFQILNIKSKELKTYRSTSGCGIGALAVHPSRNYFAVSEKGDMPNIIVYEYPSLKMYRILPKGTEKAYANLDFSPNGSKLASVGSYPDFMLTIWDWKEEKIVLRSKAFSQDVFKVAFSPDDEGHLCTSGTGHIKFWIMASTFTGLKLQGELGRFGTTELSDISGFVELPDGKVLSGSEWGNMLLWDGGLIKVEIGRKGKKSCHVGNIEQFFLDEGELITVGYDGCVKVWDFESIDAAESTDEGKVFELEPMSELKVGSDVKLLSMVKSVDEEASFIWYAQDASGRIWQLDLSFSHTSQTPEKIYSCHAGAIRGVAVSPISHIAVTTGDDGSVRLVDYSTKDFLCYKQFNGSGCSVLWVPKVVDPHCMSVLVGFSDGVVRHLTITKQSQNIRQKSSVAFHLSQVFKPHTGSVKCMAIDGEGKVLATASDDCTVFFFDVGKQFTAIGFVEMGAEVVDMHWSTIKMGNLLLVGCKDGLITEFSRPVKENFDTNKTYELPISKLRLNEFRFKTIKDDLLRAEAELLKQKKRAEKRARKQQEAERRKAKGEEGEIEENESGSEDEEEEVVQHDQGDLIKCFYAAEKGKFYLTLDAWDAGFFYECSFKGKENVVRPIKIPDINDIPISSLLFSKNSQYLLFGLTDGSLRLHDLKQCSVENLNEYWTVNLHDNDYGKVLGVAISYDMKFVLSTGNDGNFFVHSLSEGESKLMSVKDMQLKKIDNRPADDIDDPKHYSIEIEKQKSEHDRMLRLAEEKKQNVKNTISKLLSEFRKLKSRNNALPPYIQLSNADFIIDETMRLDLEKETEEKIALVYKEAQWESEKYKIALEKIKARFTDCIECDHLILDSFSTQESVSSYRANKLSDLFHEMVSENQRRMTVKENNTLAVKGNNKKMSMGVSKDGDDKEDVDFIPTVGNSQKPQKLVGKIAKVIEKAEQRKQKRLNRQKEWEELYRCKPDAEYEDPEELALIKHAQQTIGDFKLKSADNFLVPEEQRVNAEKKIASLFKLKEKVYDMKHDFNEKLLSLRERKIGIIEQVGELIDELESIKMKLPDDTSHFEIPELPKLKAHEIPERKFSFSLETLIDFRQNILKEDSSMLEEMLNEQKQVTEGRESKSMSTSAARGTTEQKSHSFSRQSSTYSSIARSSSSRQYDSSLPPTHDLDVPDDEQKSEVELTVEKEEIIRLTYRRSNVMKKISELYASFDKQLQLLRSEKIELDVDLKHADLRMVTMFEEYLLLKDFEKRENQLATKVLTKEHEKDDMEFKVEECRELLNIKKAEVEKLVEREKALFNTFTNTIGENNKFEAFLTKVFKKKVKRAKKKHVHEENSGEEESSEEESEDDFDSSDDEGDSDDELDDSVCPAGCDPAIFDQICQLRERKLDLEEILGEAKKACESLKKEQDTLIKKVKIISNALTNAGSDLEAFQREKQQKLNELDVVVMMRLDQIQYTINNVLPQDLTSCLVFDKLFLSNLQNRIKELEAEKLSQKQLYRDRKQQHIRMVRDKKIMETKIKELESKVEQIQMLKFGRLVDLDKLETISVNRFAEELKAKLKEQENSFSKEIHDWDLMIKSHNKELTKLIKENTHRLNSYTVLLQKNKELGHKLDARQKTLGGEFQGYRQADIDERQRIIQLVQDQASEINALKEEISALSRKGGHVLPPNKSTMLPNISH